MNKAAGNTITSYGLILGLIVVLSIPAIMLLGGSVSNNVDTVSDTVAGDEVSSLVSLLSKDPSNSSSSNDFTPDSTVEISADVFYDRESGKLAVIVEDGVTTAANGATDVSTNIQSSALLSVAQALENSEQTYDQDLIDLIYALGEHGIRLAEDEAIELNPEEPDCLVGKAACFYNIHQDGVGYYDGTAVDFTQNFVENYQALTEHPDYTGDLKNTVDLLAGSISQMAYHEIISKMDPENISDEAYLLTWNSEPKREEQRARITNLELLLSQTGTNDIDVSGITYVDVPPATQSAAEQLQSGGNGY